MSLFKLSIFITFLLPSLLRAAAGNPPGGPPGRSERIICAPGPTLLGGDVHALKQKVLRIITDLKQIRQGVIDNINAARNPSPEAIDLRNRFRNLIGHDEQTFEDIASDPSPQLHRLGEMLVIVSTFYFSPFSGSPISIYCNLQFYNAMVYLDY